MEDRWEALIRMIGYIEDGSQETVKLYKDDATKTCHIDIGDRNVRSYHARSFEGALQLAIDAGEGKS